MRIAGTNIPENKRMEIALTYVFGIGRSRAKEILNNAKISFDKKAKELTEKESNAIREMVEKFKIEEELRREISTNIRRLKEIKAYRGIRHMRQLPTRGQRTKTNSRTTRPYRGRKTMGSGRKKLEKT
jgi:small subunit ribosomal protein S13